MIIDATCYSCVHRKAVGTNSVSTLYMCKYADHSTQYLFAPANNNSECCKHWKPSVKDVQIWINRENARES